MAECCGNYMGATNNDSPVDMAISSPASIRSQAHDFHRTVDSPMQASNQELQSQVPFHTQLPYDRSPFGVKEDRNLPSTSRHTLQRAPRSNDTATESQDIRNSRSKRNELDAKSLSEAQERHHPHAFQRDVSEEIQPAAVSGGVRVEDEDEHGDGDGDETTNSDDSIECEPLGRPTAVSPVGEEPEDVPVSQGQPFPLVEWIRRIREESKPEWPTLPLKWARSIPKRQKIILDSDDAWYPPLPGRPVRQGTIPIDILTALTRQVDQDAEQKARKEVHSPRQEPSHSSEQQIRTSQAQHLPSSPPDPDIPWSSSPPSPPRRLLPPDTSPPRPTSGQGQQLTIAIETLRGISQDTPVASRGGLNVARKTTRSPSNRSTRIEPSQRSLPARQEREEEDEGAAALDGIPEIRTLPQERSLTSPTHQDLPVTSSGETTRLPETMPRPRPRIQVKDTPHPTKASIQDHRRYQASDDLPQSSLVAGTYPDAAMLDRRPGNPPEREISAVPRSSAVRVIAPQTHTQSMPAHSEQPERSLKRTFDKVTQKAPTIVARSSSPRGHLNSSALNNADNSQSERQRGKLDARTTQKQSTHSTRSPTTSECKAEEELRIRNKQLLDIGRLEKRRAFRASISTSIVRDGVKSVPASSLQAMDENPRAISAALSSPKSHGPTLAGSRSEGGETSATNLSLHDTSRVTKPLSCNVPRQVLVQVSGKTGGLEEMFQSFTQKYPDYSGNFKNFESALRLLIKLRSKPREPHPSLWDDFVFRMADDYKVYLQECIDEAESALPYQDFYYEHVKQSEHKAGVITAEILKIATSSTMTATTPLKRSSSNLVVHDDVVMVDVDTTNSQPLRNHATRTNVSAGQDLQDSRAHRPPTKANPTPVLQKPDKVFTHELSTERVNTDETRKRQSMPRSSGKSLRDSVMLQTQQILASSGEQTSTTTVEQWLSQPAGACSSESESTGIQPPEPDTTVAPPFNADLPKIAKKRVADSSHVHDSDLPRLRSPTYLASPKDISAKDTNATPDPLPSVTASDITPQAERPVTPFTLFARNFANLQSEKSLRNLPTNERRLPINVYEW